MKLWVAGSLLGVLCLGACTDIREAPHSSPPSPGPGGRPSGAPADPWADLSQGRPPRIAYVAGSRLIRPHAAPVRLPVGDRGISGVTPYAGGWLVADSVWFEGTNGLHFVKGGHLVRSWPSSHHCSSGSPVRSGDGRYVAWVTVRCPESDDTSIGAIHRARADGSQEVTEPIGSELAHVVGFLGSEVVYDRGFIGGARTTGFEGRSRVILRHGFVRATGAGGLLLVARGDRSRQVLDAYGTTLWHTAHGELVSFSPSGDSLLLVLGHRQGEIRDSRTGRVRGRLELPVGADPWSAAWESEAALLVPVHHHHRFAVVRVSSAAGAELATPLRPGHDGGPPYLLVASR